MDDGLDDLFGDGVPLQLSEPLPKGLLQHIDELHLNGCCQKLVWSNNGCIAYISPDGRNLILRHLICDHNDGRWGMSKEHLVEDVSATHSDHQLVHLTWSHMGNELAIVDIYGRISIYSAQFMPSINRLALMRRCISDPEDNMSAVIGMMWLHNDRQSIFHKPMYKVADVWSFKWFAQRYLGPRNPYQKPALVCVTRNGTFRVLFQGQDSRWQEFKTDIENVASPSELLTHAAMCAEKVVERQNPDKESALLLATYNNDRELRVYRVNIDFARLRISLQHIKVLNHCLPLDEAVERNLDDHDALASHAQLSHLEFVPPGPRTDNNEWTYPFIFAAFSLLSDNIQGPSAQGVQLTVLCKWQLQHTSPQLHPSFESLFSKRANASSVSDLPAGYSLKRSNDIVVSKTLLSVQQVNVGAVLAITYSDGTVEYRDRVTMELLPRDGNDRISSMAQVGFNFPARASGLHAALSPNACGVVSLDEQHVASMSLLQIDNDYPEAFFNDSLLEVVNEAFVRQYVVASLSGTLSGTQSDDCLATMQAFSNLFLERQIQPGPALADSTYFNSHFLSEFSRILQISIDYSADAQQGQILQNQYIPKLLSTQAAFGYAGEYSSRSLPARVAHTILSIRYIAMNLVTSLKPKQGETELKNPETVHLLVGMVNWSMALIIFIIDEIFMLGDLLEKQSDAADNLALDLLNQKVRDTTSPALLLILISPSRALLKFICHTMRGPLSAMIRATRGSQPLALAYGELEAVFERSPVTVSQFEKLLLELDASIKTTYQSGISDTDRNLTEREMLLKGEIPLVLMGPVKELLTVTAKTLKEEVNVAEVYFTDIGWLGLTDDQSSKRWRMQHPIDIMRKVEMKKDKPMKRCTRCGAVSEAQMQKGTNWMVMTLQRFCLCGGWWMAVGEEQTVGNGYS